MRLFEVRGTPSTDDEVIEAMQSWFEMWKPSQQVPIILNSPRIDDFKTANASKIYRCLVVKNNKISSTKGSAGIVVFTSDIGSAHEFFQSLEIDYPYIIIEKQFRPNDLVLNFSEFANSLGQSGGWDEHELWMKKTPYYSSVDESEIVYDSRVNN